ncbi:hypothetical protein AB1303_14870 [Saccharolobus solfataricus]|uniref:Uncharacterized protein n=1 Tax=Saccharolobus solfataricus TaxID=2287 RepID=A0A7S9IGA6_SACSO|nr:hypothetical protein [Saccharolobus solfataricus]QPG48604.1 hypothetical protein HFC64_00100 [Saccharolobus solfataricus]
MDKKIVIAIVSILILSVTSIELTLHPFQVDEISPPISIDLVKNYYYVTYNSSLKLFKEYPYSDTYFVESDNLLASIALKYLNLSYPVFNNIKDNLTLSPYLVLMNIHNFSWIFRNPINDEIWKNIYITNFTNTSRGYLSWYEFADLAFLYSIYLMENGNSTAMQIFSIAMKNFWNGYGFVDEAFKGEYSSYKLALAIIAWKYIYAYNKTFALKYSNDIEEMYKIASHLQSAIGGYFTCYMVINGTIIPQGNVNTETTSLFVIAFLMNPVIIKVS